MSIAQVLVVSGTLFFLYRFLLKTIGVEQLGIWSLILATSSISNLASFGISGSVVKFVAKYVAHEDYQNASRVIQTAATSVAGLVGIAIVVGYNAILWILGIVLPVKFYYLAELILPYSLISLWLISITGVFQSGLDGLQRIHLRNILLMGGTILYFILAVILAPRYGLLGLAYAQVIQGLVVMVSSWLLLTKYLSYLPIIPYRWSKAIFKEIIGYSINFQAISLFLLLTDPITKALLSKFGSVSMVGYFEMANKLIVQLRAFVVSASQVMIPVIADIQEKTPAKLKEIYLKSYQLIFYVSLPLYTLIIMSASIVSSLWIGHYENIFVISTFLLSVGWFVNTLSVPAYFAYLGIGTLRWNVIAHSIIGSLNLLLGGLLGLFYDGMGVIVGWTVALAVGSVVVYVAFNLTHKIPLSELLPRDSRKFVALSILGILLVFVSPNIIFNIKGTFINHVIDFIFIAFVISISLWFHPMRKELMGWVKNELLLKRTNI
jgi:O-antigen/teichoic acid export membrane protein